MSNDNQISVDIKWEDPECDINAAVLQIQEVLQYVLDKIEGCND